VFQESLRRVPIAAGYFVAAIVGLWVWYKVIGMLVSRSSAPDDTSNDTSE